MGDNSKPLHPGVRPGMLPPGAHAVLCIVLLTPEGVCVSVPAGIQQQLGHARTGQLMDAVAEAACQYIVTVH